MLLVVFIGYGAYLCLRRTLKVVGRLCRSVCRCIRGALARCAWPVVVVWRLLPERVRFRIAGWCDKRVGIRMRRVAAMVLRVVAATAAIPNVLLACWLAAVETCLRPLRHSGFRCLWHFVGLPVEAWVLRRREEERLERMVSAEEKRRRARQPRHKRKKKVRKQVEITLHLELGRKGEAHIHEPEKVTICERSRYETLARDMLFERRYAVAVGLIWLVAGGAVILITLRGTEDMRCTLCEEYPKLGVQVCRHGRGKACAFQQNEGRIIAAIAGMVAGCLMIAYAVFVYSPAKQSNGDTAERRKFTTGSANADLVKMVINEDVEAIEATLEEKGQVNTLPRVLKRCYRKSDLARCMRRCSLAMNRPLMLLSHIERCLRCERELERIEARLEAELEREEARVESRCSRLCCFRRKAATCAEDLEGIGDTTAVVLLSTDLWAVEATPSGKEVAVADFGGEVAVEEHGSQMECGTAVFDTGTWEAEPQVASLAAEEVIRETEDDVKVLVTSIRTAIADPEAAFVASMSMISWGSSSLQECDDENESSSEGIR